MGTISGVNWFVIALLLAVVLALLLALRLRGPTRVAVPVVVLLGVGFVCVTLHPALIDPRYRTFQRFFSEIQPGMTRAEVLAAVDSHYPAGGARTRPRLVSDSPEQLFFLMDPEGNRQPNAEGIQVDLLGGLVTRSMYMPD